MFMQYTDMSSQTNANRTASRALTGQTSIVQRMDSAAVESLKLTCRVVHSDVRVVCSEDKTRSRQSPLCSEGGTNSLKHSITNSPSQDTDMMTTKETGSAMIEEPAPTKRRGRFRTAGFSPLLGRKSRVRSSHSLEAKGGKVVAEPETGVAEQPTAETSFKETSVEVSSDGTPLKNNENPMADFVMLPKEKSVNFSVAEQDDDGLSLGDEEVAPMDKLRNFDVMDQDNVDDTVLLSDEEVAPKEKSSRGLFRRKARNPKLSDTDETSSKETSVEVSTDDIPLKSNEKSMEQDDDDALSLIDEEVAPMEKSGNFSLVDQNDDALSLIYEEVARMETSGDFSAGVKDDEEVAPMEKSRNFSVVDQDALDETVILSDEEVALKEKSGRGLFRRKARNPKLSETIDTSRKETSVEVSSNDIPLKSNEKSMAEFVMVPKKKSVNFSLAEQYDDDTVSSSIEEFASKEKSGRGLFRRKVRNPKFSDTDGDADTISSRRSLASIRSLGTLLSQGSRRSLSSLRSRRSLSSSRSRLHSRRRRKDGTTEDLDDDGSLLVSLSRNISQLSSRQLIHTVPFYQYRISDDEEDDSEWFVYNSCYLIECMCESTPEVKKKSGPSFRWSCSII